MHKQLILEVFVENFSQDWLRLVNVNVVGTVNVTSTIFPLLASRKKGHVVNMSSTMVIII